MNIIQAFITKDDSYRNNVNKVDSRYTRFQERGPIGLMLHSVGCNQPSAKVFADGWNRAGREASVHAVLQADGTVYQTMPWNFRAWHCGGAANDTHVGVEMTEPACITYTGGARFTCSDYAKAIAHVKGCYDTAVELFAMLCEKYKLNPLTAIISHKEGSDRGVASNHGDPEHLWKGLGMDYTMDGFRNAVKARMEDDDMTKEETTKLINQAVAPIGALLEKIETEILELRGMLGPMIKEYKDVPWKTVKPNVRWMLDNGVIDGGTDYEKNPDDIGLPLQLLRVLICADRDAAKRTEDLEKRMPCYDE